MRPFLFMAAVLSATLIVQNSDAAQKNVTPVIAPPYSYADLADLALAAPIVAHVRIKDAKKIRPEIAPGLKAGSVRFLIIADVIALVRGDAGLPPRISYLVDMPTDSHGKTARLSKSESLVFGEIGRAGEIRLIATDGQIAWSAAAAKTVRDVLGEAAKPDAAPRITSIASGFTSHGSLPGERETQIFLDAIGDKPVSLTVLRQPGEPPRWYVSLGEVVDDAAAQPLRDSLLWYRLACFLPPIYQADKLSEMPATDAAAVRADYQLIMSGLGRCPRTRKAA